MRSIFDRVLDCIVLLVSSFAILGTIISVASYFSGIHTKLGQWVMFICVPIVLIGMVILWKSRKARKWFLEVDFPNSWS